MAARRKGEGLSVIGTKGFWIDDNEYCEIVGVTDEGAGLYEFKSLETDDPTIDALPWIGFIEDFFPEE